MGKNKVDFDLINERRNTKSAKWDEMDEKYFIQNIIHLGVADMDFQSPKEVIQCMKELVDKGVFGYTVLDHKFYEAIIEWIERRFSIHIPKEWIVFCPRITTSASLTIRLFSEPGDKIILQSPYYGPLREVIEENGRTMLDSPLVRDEDGIYRMDFDHLEKVVDETTKIFLLCNPHNPTGRVWDERELDQIHEFCKKHDLLLYSDEIHSDIIAKGETFESALSLMKKGEQKLIVANAPTKTFNIPGLIISYLIVPDVEIRSKLYDEIQCLGMRNPNIFSAIALEKAYTECDGWLEHVNKYIDSNENLVKKFFEKHIPEFQVTKRQGTYLLWVNYEELGLGEKELHDWFIERAKVSVYMGTTFGMEGYGYFRMNIATSKHLLEEALERMKKAYQCFL